MIEECFFAFLQKKNKDVEERLGIVGDALGCSAVHVTKGVGSEGIYFCGTGEVGHVLGAGLRLPI